MSHKLLEMGSANRKNRNFVKSEREIYFEIVVALRDTQGKIQLGSFEASICFWPCFIYRF